MRSLVATSQSAYTLTVLSGPDRGAIYKLVAGHITVGRDPDNTIVIRDDPKVSRQHALIVVSSTGIQIRDTSGHNKMLINGEPTESCQLHSGTIIQLGGTKLIFKLAEVQSLAAASSGASSDVAIPNQNSSFDRMAPKSKGNNRIVFYSIVAAIVLIAVWLANQKTNRGKASELSTAPALQSTIKTDQQIVDDVDKAKARAGENTPQYSEAHRQYIQGFREYEKGQYSRAVVSFQACVALIPQYRQYPQFQECENYLSLAQNSFQELIQRELQLGSEYKDQGQYNACVAAYRNVLFMMDCKNLGQKLCNLARAGHDACIALGGRDE